ncbi:MAG: RNA methyltransferase [Cyclobacteriaceae bacterium]|nr:RNA methyltransferase [Cyclobacteriaceae bacterium]
MLSPTPLEELTYLNNFISEHKKKLMDKVLDQRTRFVTVVLEDIYQSHNASAVLRSCDCFGVQDVHVIENRNRYSVDPTVAMGSSKWVDILRYNTNDRNTTTCLRGLKKEGYSIIATTPEPMSESINDVELTGKIALVFGTELTGLSEEALALADNKVKIPMYGFTESFNISVCAALFLNIIRDKLNKSDLDWQLTREEKIAIKLNWCKKVVKRSNKLLEEYFNKNREI